LLKKDDVLSKTALFDRLRVLVLLTAVVVLRRKKKHEDLYHTRKACGQGSAG
jgi:hypothetical protein